MNKILLVEDEAHVVSFIKKGLSEDGFDLTVAFDGNMGLQMFETNNFDLIILDIMLPGMNGLEVCKAIRKTNQTVPVLFLTALGTSENIVLGLETGADDYLVKPFKFIELVARVKSLLRRSENFAVNNEEQNPDIYRFSNLVVNDASKKVQVDDKEIMLTTTEYKLLLYFIKNKDRVLSRMDILEAVWGVDFDMGTNVVDVYVNYLRKKIDSQSDNKLIHTVIGMGYVLREA
jgi:DNA-binding response OmpR family regulator